MNPIRLFYTLLGFTVLVALYFAITTSFSHSQPQPHAQLHASVLNPQSPLPSASEIKSADLPQVVTTPDASVKTDSLKNLSDFSQEFEQFYPVLFDQYRSSTGVDLKALGEAVSYAGELKIILQTALTLLELTSGARGAPLAPSDNSVQALTRWNTRQIKTLEMHFYFLNRLAQDSRLSQYTVGSLNQLMSWVKSSVTLLKNSVSGARGAPLAP